MRSIDLNHGIVSAHASMMTAASDLALMSGSHIVLDLAPNTGVAEIDGDKSANTLYGGTEADLMNGYANNDVISGYAGDDTINGGTGNDVLIAGSGNNLLNGGPGADTMICQNGFDTVNGGGGNDTVLAGINAEVNDIQGRNHFVFNPQADPNHEVYQGSDTITGGAKHETLDFSAIQNVGVDNVVIDGDWITIATSDSWDSNGNPVNVDLHIEDVGIGAACHNNAAKAIEKGLIVISGSSTSSSETHDATIHHDFSGLAV